VKAAERRERRHDPCSSKRVKEGQCVRNPACRYGYRHVGFCGGWAKGVKQERKTRGGGAGGNNNPGVSSSFHASSSSSRRKPKPGLLRCDKTASCPRPLRHSGICGPTRRVWYSAAALSLPLTGLACLPACGRSAECKACNAKEEQETTNVDQIMIMSYRSNPNECICVPPITPPESWSWNAPLHPVWLEYGSRGTWRELPMSEEEARALDSIPRSRATYYTLCDDDEDLTSSESSSSSSESVSEPRLKRRRGRGRGRGRRRGRGGNSSRRRAGHRRQKSGVVFDFRKASTAAYADMDDSKLNDHQRFVKKLTRKMIERGMSQVAVSKACGVPQTVISKIIRMPEYGSSRKEEYYTALRGWLEGDSGAKAKAKPKRAKLKVIATTTVIVPLLMG